jgi:hypothetical protein
VVRDPQRSDGSVTATLPRGVCFSDRGFRVVCTPRFVPRHGSGFRVAPCLQVVLDGVNTPGHWSHLVCRDESVRELEICRKLLVGRPVANKPPAARHARFVLATVIGQAETVARPT